MRGVVSLAAALSLPAFLPDGRPFPQRDLIIFFTFTVIFATLVLQGITLPPLIRALGLSRASGPNCEEVEARRIVLGAALAHLGEAKATDTGDTAALYDDLIGHYEQRLANIRPGRQDREHETEHGLYLGLSLEALRVERETAIRLRDEGRISDEVLRLLERELDLTEARMEDSVEP